MLLLWFIPSPSPSLDPENDPLCGLLLIDLLSLRAREYAFLTRMFQEWEVSWQPAPLAGGEWELDKSRFLGLHTLQ